MSGFDSLEQSSPIVQVADGVPTTTSMRIANGTRVQHKNVLELIRGNLADFEEFGGVAFETRPFDTAGGMQMREVAVLNEEHATLLLTYMRNSDIVRDFKKRLVREFSRLRREAETRPAINAAELTRLVLSFDLSARSGALPEQVYQLLAGLPPLRDLDRVDGVNSRVRHFNTPHSARVAPRYVARGVLLAAAWLQGRGRSRQASVTGPRPVGTTTPGGAR